MLLGNRINKMALEMTEQDQKSNVRLQLFYWLEKVYR